MLELKAALDAGDYEALKRRVNAATPAELLPAWSALGAFEKVAVFKLLEPDAALAFFEALGFSDRYLVFSGLEPGVVAPIVEKLGPGADGLFTRLGPDAYERMLGRLTLPSPAGGRGR